MNTISLSFSITEAWKIYQILWEITDVSYENEITFHQDSDFARRHFHRCKQHSYLFQTIFNTANEGTNNIRIPIMWQENSKEMSVGGGKSYQARATLYFVKNLKRLGKTQSILQCLTMRAGAEERWCLPGGCAAVMQGAWRAQPCHTRGWRQSRMLPATRLCHGLHR